MVLLDGVYLAVQSGHVLVISGYLDLSAHASPLPDFVTMDDASTTILAKVQCDNAQPEGLAAAQRIDTTSLTSIWPCFHCFQPAAPVQRR